MPQIWVSYEELGNFLGCDGHAAASHVDAACWPRRRCHDGLTRAKVPLDIAFDIVQFFFGVQTRRDASNALFDKQRELPRAVQGEIGHGFTAARKDRHWSNR